MTRSLLADIPSLYHGISIYNCVGHMGHTFDDIIASFIQVFHNLNIPVQQHNEIKLDNDVWLIFGMDQLPEDQSLPMCYIAYQLEQFCSPRFTAEYLERLEQADEIWEYSRSHWPYYKNLDKVHYVPVYYTLSLERPITVPKKIFDVLFYGSLNERRQQVMMKMHQLGLKIIIHHNCWGDEQVRMIKEARIVINIHHFQEDGILELTRIGKVIANKTLVVSERGKDEEQNQEFQDCIVFGDYDDLPQLCQHYCQNEKEREARVQQAYETYQTKYRLCDVIEEMMG
jgi:hypothetical protein